MQRVAKRTAAAQNHWRIAEFYRAPSGFAKNIADGTGGTARTSGEAGAGRTPTPAVRYFARAALAWRNSGRSPSARSHIATSLA